MSTKSEGTGSAGDATIEHPAHVPASYVWDASLGEDGGWTEPAGDNKDEVARLTAKVAKAEDELKDAKAALAAAKKEG